MPNQCYTAQASFQKSNDDTFWADGDLIYVRGMPGRPCQVQVVCSDPAVDWEVRWQGPFSAAGSDEAIAAGSPPAWLPIAADGLMQVNCRRQNAGPAVVFEFAVS